MFYPCFIPAADGMGSALAALFERKDGAMGAGFGMGGLLGFSGGIQKMPSFRVSMGKVFVILYHCYQGI